MELKVEFWIVDSPGNLARPYRDEGTDKVVKVSKLWESIRAKMRDKIIELPFLITPMMEVDLEYFKDDYQFIDEEFDLIHSYAEPTIHRMVVSPNGVCVWLYYGL